MGSTHALKIEQTAGLPKMAPADERPLASVEVQTDRLDVSVRPYTVAVLVGDLYNRLDQQFLRNSDIRMSHWDGKMRV
jgi:hypothetical protein